MTCHDKNQAVVPGKLRDPTKCDFFFLLISRFLNAKSQMGYLDNEGHLTKARIGHNVAATCCFHLLQTLEVL